MLHQFRSAFWLSFRQRSEYVNYTVARLLNKLLIEFTRSRPNRSQDNGLVEGKNGAVIRKHIGYGHIPEVRREVQKFYTAHFNPYLNFHRPCGFARVVEGARGKRRKVYRSQDYMTPYEKLKSLPQAEKFLKPGIRLESLERRAADERHRVGTEDAPGQGGVVARVKLESPTAPRD